MCLSCPAANRVHFLLTPGEDGVKELQRKRHSATPGVSFKGRVRKAARLNEESDGESDEESESNLFQTKFQQSCTL